MKVVVLFSGGVDSTVLLASKLAAGATVIALSFDYGQKHDKELKAAEAVIDYYSAIYHERLQPLTINLQNVFGYGDTSSLLRGSQLSVPKEGYTVATPSTYVPFRNGIMLSVATSIALQVGADCVAYAAHADDAIGSAYPDCSPQFASAMDLAVVEGTNRQCWISAPFILWPKSKIVALGLQLEVPFHLTWSCYEGGEKPCGKCGTCRDRIQAFDLNGIKEEVQ